MCLEILFEKPSVLILKIPKGSPGNALNSCIIGSGTILGGIYFHTLSNINQLNKSFITIIIIKDIINIQFHSNW